MQVSRLTLVLWISVFLVFSPTAFVLSHGEINIPAQANTSRVLNRNTGKNYSTIQEAVNAQETLDGHEILVEIGTYYEHVTINKSLSLVGEDRITTIIDGNGGDTAIHVTANNVTVRNLTTKNGTFGILLDNSNNSKIIGNTVQDNQYGIRLYQSPNTEVEDNGVYRSTWFGLELDSSGNSTLRNNVMADNNFNFGVDGTFLSDFINDIDTSNRVNDKPVRYLTNWRDVSIDASTFRELGYAAFVNSSNIKVQNLDVQRNVQGLLFAFTSNSVISNVKARNNWNGIYLAHSRNNSVTDNSANNNYDYGIRLFNSSCSTVRRNNVDNNGWAGIGLFRSSNSTVDGNEANYNTYNLHFVYTNNSLITKNDAVNKPGGHSIVLYYSHNNFIFYNTFDNGLLYNETRNWAPFTPRNNWDNGFEGNYWRLCIGVDADQDGIGDNPCIIGQNNVDNHPLMGGFSDFTVTLEGKTYSIAIISNSTISNLEFGSEEANVRFSAVGLNRTIGFSRIGVPNALLQTLRNDSLTFLVNGQQPILQRSWTNGEYTYWYLSYVNSVPERLTTPWLIPIVAIIALATVLIVLVLLKKKHRSDIQSSSNKGEDHG